MRPHFGSIVLLSLVPAAERGSSRFTYSTFFATYEVHASSHQYIPLSQANTTTSRKCTVVFAELESIRQSNAQTRAGGKVPLRVIHRAVLAVGAMYIIAKHKQKKRSTTDERNKAQAKQSSPPPQGFRRDHNNCEVPGLQAHVRR